MKTRPSLMLVSLALSLLLLGGCGETKGPESSKDGAKASVATSKLQASSEEVQKLAKDLQPLLDASKAIHEGILDTIQKLGYQHITQDQAKAQIKDFITQNDALRQKVSQLEEAPELNKAVEYLSTGVYLRQGHFKELATLLEQPNPKPSQFNNIIKQVKTDYSFTEKAQGELQALTNNKI